jgi:hypothetical protein
MALSLDVLAFLADNILFVLAFLLSFIFIFRCLNDDLASIPGPFLARFSDLWRLWIVLQGRSQETLLELHRKYGTVVRIGPDCIDVSDPEAVEPILGIGNRLQKVCILTYVLD